MHKHLLFLGLTLLAFTNQAQTTVNAGNAQGISSHFCALQDKANF